MEEEVRAGMTMLLDENITSGVVSVEGTPILPFTVALLTEFRRFIVFLAEQQGLDAAQVWSDYCVAQTMADLRG